MQTRWSSDISDKGRSIQRLKLPLENPVMSQTNKQVLWVAISTLVSFMVVRELGAFDSEARAMTRKIERALSLADKRMKQKGWYREGALRDQTVRAFINGDVVNITFMGNSWNRPSEDVDYEFNVDLVSGELNSEYQRKVIAFEVEN